MYGTTWDHEHQCPECQLYCYDFSCIIEDIKTELSDTPKNMSETAEHI